MSILNLLSAVASPVTSLAENTIGRLLPGASAAAAQGGSPPSQPLQLAGGVAGGLLGGIAGKLLGGLL
jgi:predicted lipid-binding transport protein (Tim44 family)